ncbi:MAG: 4Fe-4S binding protein [Clostridia bacterium]|nr:4Fe-4S binding protein [Clostridia bacterium]
MSPYPEFDSNKCVKCYACIKACPKKALNSGENQKEKPASVPVAVPAVGIAKDFKAGGVSLEARLDIKLTVDANVSEDHLRNLLRVIKEELNLER